jgi:hypothetical protein
MKKAVKIAILSAAVASAAAGILFVVIPLVTSKKTEAMLGVAFAEAGIPETMWSADKAYYVPLFGHWVVENLEFGDREGGGFLTAKKVTIALNLGEEDLASGFVDANDVSFSAADTTSITVKKLSVNDFSVDRALFKYSPAEAVKKLGNIRLNGAVFRNEGRKYFSLRKLNADVNYADGKIPPHASVSLQECAVDVRQFQSLPALRPEYLISNFELTTSFSGGVYAVNLVIDGENLFTINAHLNVSLPSRLLESGEINNLALINYGEDLKLDSFTLSYTDKSCLDHVFEVAEIQGGKEAFAEDLNETFMMFAMTNGFADAERFAEEVTKFIKKPGKFELKANNDSPVSFKELSQESDAMNLNLSINGGMPFINKKQ